ncbi:Calcium-binding mitochondrial carrier protein Aralar1 [Nymphon striatum]|nr:Calcium-binding mitochondrial carrier protein Aralar1 [Nymphon striatum]
MIFGSVKKADTEQLELIFNKYASIEKDGELLMTPGDFVRGYLGLYPGPDYNQKTVEILGSSLDTSKDGFISFPEFHAFETLLCAPDALYRTAFQIFDLDGTGDITFDEFKDVVTHTTLHKYVPFEFEGDFIALHFGKNTKRTVSYAEFGQVLHDFHEEYAIQAFKRFDKKKTGVVSAVDFNEIMKNIKNHLLTPDVRENLVAVARSFGSKVSFPFFMAFNSLLNNMDSVKRMYLNVSKGNLHLELTKEEFLHSALQLTRLTPMEVEILFSLADLIHHKSGRINYAVIEKLAPQRHVRPMMKPITEVKAVKDASERGVLIQILENVYRFTLGSVAGAMGATAVYPIDLVKTRMQNQRTGSYVGELMYKNSLDCLKKVIRHEGIPGLYRGLGPQIIGVAPEKAIKLTVNDFFRDKLSNEKGELPLWAGYAAGGIAGASQVVFTNPLEIVKIRLQVAGEITGGPKISALGVIKDLGFFGLYKGARACLLRDIPFSAIYFPVYAAGKEFLADEDGNVHPLSLLAAAFIAGVPAASLTTPADVIKTRLQVQAKAGQTTYNGVFDAAKKIFKEEGTRAFWKGAPARVARSSPQFAVTLAAYEIFQRLIYVDFGGRRPQGSQQTVPVSPAEIKSHNPDHIGGYRLALTTLSGFESKFGLFLPKYSSQVH